MSLGNVLDQCYLWLACEDIEDYPKVTVVRGAPSDLRSGVGKAPWWVASGP